jgi:carboxylesterase type B
MFVPAVPSLGLGLLGLAAIISPVLADDLTISTAQGIIQGTHLQSSVRRWLGIPYAASTAGANRWTVPKPPPVIPQGSAFDASSFGDSCPQDLSSSNLELIKLAGLNANVSQSEDCLSLNIWAPPMARANKTAVLIWVYGGAFAFGTVSENTLRVSEAETEDLEQYALLRGRGFRTR